MVLASSPRRRRSCSLWRACRSGRCSRQRREACSQAARLLPRRGRGRRRSWTRAARAGSSGSCVAADGCGWRCAAGLGSEARAASVAGARASSRSLRRTRARARRPEMCRVAGDRDAPRSPAPATYVGSRDRAGRRCVEGETRARGRATARAVHAWSSSAFGRRAERALNGVEPAAAVAVAAATTSGGSGASAHTLATRPCTSRSATNTMPSRPGYSQSAGYSPAYARHAVRTTSALHAHSRARERSRHTNTTDGGAPSRRP